MITIREYLDPKGHSPFARWFKGLNAQAAAKVTTSLIRIEQGNFTSTKEVGAGVFEWRIDFGPGYRVYFGKDGDALVILIGGGKKGTIARTSRPPTSAGEIIRGAKLGRYSYAIDARF